MPVELSLSPEQARLVSLAIAYHLGRPGADIEPNTLQPSTHGLAMPAGILQAQHGLPEAKLTLDAQQVRRLLEAMLQAINELKVLGMQDEPWAPGAGLGRSVNQQFEMAVVRLYPAIQRHPRDAQDVAAAMMDLRRRLVGAQSAVEAAAGSRTGVEAPPEGRRARPWWRFWG